MMGRNRGRAALAAVGLIALASAAARGGPFDGKQMRFYTMGSPGGGYDTHVRTLIPHLEKRLGAKLVPLNEAGAGGLLAINRVLTATPDGTTFVLTSGEGLVTAVLYGLQGVNYDLKTLEWIARVSEDSKVVLVSAKSEFAAFADLLKGDRRFISGGSGKTDGNSDYTAIMCHALAIKCQIVLGYKGTGDLNLAIETGEIHSRIVTEEAGARFVKGGNAIRPLATLARERSEAFPDSPTIFEVAKPSEQQSKWLDWRAGIAALGRVVVATPGTPKPQLEALRAGFKEVIADPAFVAEAKSRGLQVRYASGEAVRAMVDRTMAALTPKELDELKDIVLNKYYAR
jgi:tripartite-type tricarboxylate transporter receptor subunit TctC